MTIGGARPRPAGLALQDPPLPQTRGAGRTIWEDRNMKKRLISWLLILALCVSVLPAAALAAELEAAAESVAETTAEPTGTKQTITPAEPLRAVTSGTGTHEHFLCGGATCNKVGHDDEGSNKVTFEAWTGITNVGTGGAYYLTGDIGGFTVPNGVDLTLCLNGHDISQASSNDPAVTVAPGATFTLCDCNGSHTVVGGRIMHSVRDNKYGIGVYVGEQASVNNNAVFNMYSGTICNNTSTDRVDGGGVTVMGGTFNLYGGTISDNQALSGKGIGGGVFVANQGTFNMSGGTITRNQAISGGGVFVGGAYTSADRTSFNGTFDMSGGSITGNTAGGGVHVNTYSTLTTFKVSGTAEITGNQYNGATQNVYLPSEHDNKAIIVVGKLDSSASIGVTTQEVGMTVAENISKVNADHFFSDNSKKYRLKYSSVDKTLTMVEVTTEHTAHPVCGEAGCTKHDSVDSWTPISKLSEISGTGNYYLTDDVELDATGWTCGNNTVKNVTLCLNGHSITKNGTEAAIKLNTFDGITLNLCDCVGSGEIMHGTDANGETYTGAGVEVPSKQIFNMYGGTITGNKNTFGGGVLLGPGSTFNMHGGSITKNEAYSTGGTSYGQGGGVYAQGISGSYAYFNMYGGTIEDNTATYRGGGVYVGGYAQFSMSGGSITGNTAAQGGGVYYSERGLIVSGNVQIKDNHDASGSANNVYVVKSSNTDGCRHFYIGQGGLGENAEIGITFEGTIATGERIIFALWAERGYYDGNFTYDNNNNGDYSFKKELDPDEYHTRGTHVVSLYNGLPHKHAICGKTAENCTDSSKHTDVTWTPLTSDTSGTPSAGGTALKEGSFNETKGYVLSAGHYYLNAELALNKPLLIKNGVYLCLNGQTLTVKSDNSAVIIDTGCDLTLCDCSEEQPGKITHAASATGRGVYMGTSTGTANNYNGRFTMYGGSITGNTTQGQYGNGAGVYMKGKGTFNMHGGRITGNTTEDTNANGGGVCVNGGTFNMTGGSITNNTATGSYATGGGVYAVVATFNMSGNAVISNNNAYCGGGVYVNSVTFNMSGNAAITGNSADYGGGVYVTNGTAAPGTFTMSGNASISGNSANYGGGVYMRESNSNFTMSESATVSGNTAKAAGGGVNLTGGGTFTMESGSITGNNVTGSGLNSSGGGVCVSTGTFNMTGGSITGNNVYLSSDAFENEGGGGVYVAERATMNVSDDVQIHDNWKNGKKNGDVYEKGETGSDNNLYLYAYKDDSVLKTVAIGTDDLASTAKIGVTTRYTPTASNPIKIATGAQENVDYTGIFTPDVTDYTVTKDGTTLYLSAHEHHWKYEKAANGEEIMVSCDADGCDLNGQKIHYTLCAPATSTLTYDGNGKPAKVSVSPSATGVTLPTPSSISYVKAEPYQQLENGAVPTNAGTYYASVTVGTETATVTYEIKKATPQASDFIFSGPEDLAYDGNAKIAWVTSNTIGGITITRKNYKDGVKIDGWPIDVGTYTVKIDVTESTNYTAATDLTDELNWKFTIQKGTYGGTPSPKTVEIVKGRSAAQTGTLTAADFFPEGQMPADAAIVGVTPTSGTIIDSIAVDGTKHELNYVSNTNITATENESYTVTISTKNYSDFTVTLTFHPADKQPQTNFAFKDVVDGKVAKVYGDPDFKFEATGQVNGSNVTGYDSSNENVATVANDGTVTIKGAGAAVIKATASATDDYAEGKAEYTLTVSKKTLTEADLEFTQSSTFTKVYDGTASTTATVQIKATAKVNTTDTLPEVKGTYAYNSKDVKGATKVTFTSERTENTNYILPEGLTVENNASITKRVLTVGEVDTISKTYNTYKNALDCVTGIELIGTVETLRFYTSAETGGDYGIMDTEFDNANAGQNKQITGTVALLGSSALASNYTFMVDGKESNNAPFTATGEITQADSWALTPVNDLTIRYNNRDAQTYTPNWSTLLPSGQTWTYNSENTAYTGSANLSTNTIGADTGVLGYQLSAGAENDTVTWTITASCNNYQTFTLTVTLKLIARDPQTNFKFENNTTSVSKTYGDGDFTIKATDAAAGSTVSYESSNTSVATVDNTGKVTIVGAGQTTIKAKASETPDFDEKVISYTLTVNKLSIAVPTAGLNNKLEYNGKEQTYTPAGLNTEYCTIINNKATDVLANNDPYYATVSLRDTANTEWNEGVDNTTPRECQFWILPARAIVTALDKKITTGQPAPDLTTAKLGEDYTITGLYDGDSLGSIGLYYADPADTATEVTTPDTSKAGTYAIVAKLDGEGNSNYTLMSAPGTLTIEAVQTSQKLGISAPGRTPGGSYELTPKNAQPGDTVTITVSPDKGCELGSLTVRDMDGNELDLKRERNGDYTFTMPKSSVSVSVTFVREDDALFDDVFAGDYYYNAVQWAAEQGITGGVGGNLFAPDASCTRAQIVTFLWRAAGSPAPETMSAFADVPATAYYAKAVAWAVENGITNGTGDGKFSPDAPCTRAQAVTFLARALDESADGAADFTDVSADAYYAKPVAWAVEANVTNGVSKTQFAPNENCTRAQIVTFLYRAYKRTK